MSKLENIESKKAVISALPPLEIKLGLENSVLKKCSRARMAFESHPLIGIG
ncbi:MAG: hypothetical protein ACRC6M_12320 [Microcystaceae cyanobacterium]